MELDYFLVDVFTETALSGNPLAVVMNSVGLTAERMQAIAREFNLSETTFVERRAEEVEQREGVQVRIFTTQEELNFAGHPTLGTASVLRMNAPETVRENTVTLKENVGAVPVRFAEAGLFGEMTQPDPEFGAEPDAAEVARLCGLEAEDLDSALRPQIVSTGTAFAIVALRSHEALAKLRVSQQEAAAWLRTRGARWFYVLGPTGGEAPAWRARLQFYGGEDPATGSAAGCAISYLVQRGAVASGKRIHLRQGVEMGRPSELYLSAQRRNGSSQTQSASVSEVRVGGSTVLVAKGRLFLP
ncbi:MAG TPA: PhzF family phenazine biosynthesis protein [Terracidiphilus sp.]|nr:PhzF family phenazine biosynthesis protein [Terracidiphilus sp.]